MEKKIETIFDAVGFGFPVKIVNAPMIKIRGEWVLDLDQNKLQEVVLIALANKPTKLTGNEIHFIRTYFSMTTTVFGEKFDVSHAAVLKWEKAAGRSTGMGWATEKDIRLFIRSTVRPKASDFLEAYKELEEKIENSKAIPVEIDARLVA